MDVNDWNGFDMRLAYTHLVARNGLTGKELARRPKDSLSASIDYRWAFGLSTGVEFASASSRWDDQANSQLVPGHSVVTLRTAYPVAEGVEVFGRVVNLFDRKYEVVRSYGTPGRSAYAGVRARF